MTAPPTGSFNVEAEKTGSLSVFKVITLATGQTLRQDFGLLAVGSSTPITGLTSAPATVTDSRGGAVTFPAGSLVDGSGTQVDSATVEVTTSLSTDAGFASAFPGSFVDGSGTPIESFGFITVKITDDNGQPVNLDQANSQTADIAIPIDPNNDPGLSTINIYSLDEATGKWEFATTATRDDTTDPAAPVYRATVSHFSTYSGGIQFTSPLPFTVTVVDTGGGAVEGCPVTFTLVDSNFAVSYGVDVTDFNGQVFFPSIQPGSLNFTASCPNGQVGGAGQFGGTSTAPTATIVLHSVVTGSYTLEYIDVNSQQQLPVPQNSVASASGPNGVTGYGHGATYDNLGDVTIGIVDNGGPYTYGANVQIGAQWYGVHGSVSTIGGSGGIPALWVLTACNMTPGGCT